MKRFLKTTNLFVIIVMTAMLALSDCSSKNEGNVSGGSDEPQGTSSGTGGGQTYVLKLGHIAPDEHSYTKGVEQFAKAVEEASGGRLKIELYGGGQLGGEREVTEQVQLGALDMTLVTAGPVGNFVEKFSVLEMPFLFRDLDHVYKTLDGEVGQELAKLLDEAGFVTLGFWENGFRHLTSNKRPIKSPEDAKGMKFRTVENPLYVATYKAIGGDPTPIAFPETYTSLHQGVVDGMDQSYGVMASTKMYEVQEYLSEVGIYYAAAPLLMNKSKFESLPQDLQQILKEKGQEYAVIQRQINQDMEGQQKKDMIALGLKVVERQDVDLEGFKRAVQSVYDEFGPKFGDLLDKIQAVQ